MRLPDTRDPGRPARPDPMTEALSLHPGWWRSVDEHTQQRRERRDKETR